MYTVHTETQSDNLTQPGAAVLQYIHDTILMTPREQSAQ